MPLFLLKFIGLPRWVHALAGVGVLIAAFFLWLHFHDRGVIDEHEAGIAVQVQAQASEAAADATEAVVETRREVESVNKRARDGAAAKPNDPLKGALDAMGDKR